MRRRAPATVLVLVYMGTWAGASLAFSTAASDLDLFFWPAAQVAVHGQPLHLYSVPGLGTNAIDNGPLGILLLVPVAAVANVAGWAHDLGPRSAVVDGVFALGVLAMTGVALRVVGVARDRLAWRLAGTCVFLVAPPVWIGVIDYGHVEQPVELLLVLLAVTAAVSERWLLGGFFLGLAVLTRSTAVLYGLPFVAVLLATRRPRPALVLAVAATATIAAGIVPFLIADGATVVHSLVTYRGALPVGGGSLWVISYDTRWASLIEHGDVAVVMAVAVALTALAAWRRPVAVGTTSGLLALLTVVSVTFPMLAKTVYPYYVLEPYVFAAAWWLARPGSAWNSRLAAPVLLTADVFLAKAGGSLPFTGWGMVEGIASSSLLALVVVLVMTDLFRTSYSEATPVRTSTPAASTAARAAPATSHA